MNKKLSGKTTIAKKKIAYSLFGVAALLILFLCIGVLRRVVYGVFGYAIYAYLPALIVVAVLILVGKKPKVSIKSMILYVSLFFMAVVTLHIGLSKSIIEGSSYLPNTYASNTVGGVLVGLLASLFRLICAGNYGIMLALTFVITAVLGLVALYPLILEMGRGGKPKGKKGKISDTFKTPRINNMHKNNKGVYVEDEPQIAYGGRYDEYEPQPERYDGVVNVSGMKDDLFGTLTSEGDRQRSKADKSANLLFGEEDRYQAPQQSAQIDGNRYSTLSALGSDDGINRFITSQNRMRDVEGSLRPRTPQEEYEARFGGGFNKGYAGERANSGFDPMAQYGNPSLYSNQPSSYSQQTLPRESIIAPVQPTVNRYENLNNVGGDMYLRPQISNPYGNGAEAADSYRQEPAPQNGLNDRAKALDFINTPLTGEELINMDFSRPSKRGSNDDYAYMYDDTYASTKNTYAEDVQEVKPRYVEAVQPTVEKAAPQPTYSKETVHNVTTVEKTVPQKTEEPKPRIVESPKPQSQPQPKPIAVQEKINVTPKPQPKPVYTSNVMAKEKAPVFEEEKKEKKPYVPKPYKVPSYDILNDYTESSTTFPEDYNIIKEKIDQTMEEFDVPATVFDARRGPTFTMYYLNVGSGYKLSRIESVKDNLKMRLCVKNLIIHAPIAGQNALGIELPNTKRDTVGLKSILCSSEFNSDSKGLKFAMGKTLEGLPFISDITKMPHMLVAGSTGTGKSVFLNAVLTSLLFKYSPDDLRLVLIDPKKVELTVYRNLPNLLIKEPVKEAKHAVNALRWLCAEMDRRYEFFSKVGCANIQQYNDLYRKPDEPKMYRILLVIDEMADLMINSKDSSVEDYIVRIAQLARACGIHMIIATQRPTVKVITGLIKSNIMHRVAFAVKTSMDSRVILDAGGAEELLGLGDMLYSNSDGLVRMQGAFIDTPEIKKVCDFIRENNESEYDEAIANAVTYEPPKPETPEERSAAREEERDAEFEKQLQIILKSFIKTGKASVSSAQASHHVGYIKAKKLVDAMTERGYIGPEDGAKPREILITMEEWEDLFGEKANNIIPETDDEDYDGE